MEKKNTKQTSPKIATKAAKLLKQSKVEIVKEVAGSALSQAGGKAKAKSKPATKKAPAKRK